METQVGYELPRNATERDAIHIPLIPVTLNEDMLPGEQVTLVDGKTDVVRKVDKNERALGIVDPFFRGSLWRGSRVYLFLFPGSTHSLRHAWRHPAFTSKDEAEAYMERVARQINTTKASLLEAADQWVYSEEYTYDNSEDYKGAAIDWTEFWFYYEVLKGKAATHKECFFTCSC